MGLIEIVNVYSVTLGVLTALALLMFVQVVVADVAAIKTRHTPGYPVEADHNSFLFRAVRAQGNTTETALIYVICACLCAVLSVNPTVANGFSVVYIAGRLGHMLCYYFNIRVMRSVSFAVSMLGIAGLLVSIIWAALV